MEENYHICHLCPSFNNVIYSMLAEQQQLIGNTVRVFYYRTKGSGLPNGEKDYVDGVMPYSNCDRFFYFLKEKKILKSFLEKYKPDQFQIYHAHTLFSAGYVAMKAGDGCIPYIVAVRGTDINGFFKYRFYLRKTGIKILCRAKKIVFISKTHKEQVFQRYIPSKYIDTLEKKCVVIPNGIDDFWLNNIVSKRRIPNSKKLRLIYYGDLNKNKNIELTIEAVRMLKAEGYAIKLYIIGKIQEKKYDAMINENDSIEYHSFMPKEKLISYLRKSDIFVMPSKSETFGLSYVEAMSQGVPVIYTKGQGFDGQFPEGTVGYHVNSDEPSDIVTAIHRILNDYTRISNMCIEKSKEFSWKEIARQYQEIYREMAKV